MKPREQVAFVSKKIDGAVRGLADLVQLEVVVTIVCALIPFGLMYAEAGPVRGSISAFYSVERAQFFYMPLTAAAMLFIVNGVVRDQHWYNLWLGLAVAALTFFDHIHFTIIHNISAASFFIGNALVFVIFTPRKELWIKLVLAGAVVVALAAHFVFGWLTLFWAESLSLWAIALHFFFEAKGWTK